MSKSKIYSARVSISFEGRFEIEGTSKKDAQEKIQRFLDINNFCDIRQNIKKLSQFNQVPISWIDIKK